jgi:hypothetical protein
MPSVLPRRASPPIDLPSRAAETISSCLIQKEELGRAAETTSQSFPDSVEVTPVFPARAPPRSAHRLAVP